MKIKLLTNNGKKWIPVYKDALQDGRLGKVFIEFNDLLKNEFQSADDYLDYHVKFDGFK